MYIGYINYFWCDLFYVVVCFCVVGGCVNARARELVCILQFTSYISSYLVVFRWISPRKSMHPRLSLISQTETSRFQ